MEQPVIDLTISKNEPSISQYREAIKTFGKEMLSSRKRHYDFEEKVIRTFKRQKRNIKENQEKADHSTTLLEKIEDRLDETDEWLSENSSEIFKMSSEQEQLETRITSTRDNFKHFKKRVIADIKQQDYHIHNAFQKIDILTEQNQKLIDLCNKQAEYIQSMFYTAPMAGFQHMLKKNETVEDDFELPLLPIFYQ
jgi:chromosome segregation ATPase